MVFNVAVYYNYSILREERVDLVKLITISFQLVLVQCQFSPGP